MQFVVHIHCQETMVCKTALKDSEFLSVARGIADEPFQGRRALPSHPPGAVCAAGVRVGNHLKRWLGENGEVLHKPPKIRPFPLPFKNQLCPKFEQCNSSLCLN